MRRNMSTAKGANVLKFIKIVPHRVSDFGILVPSFIFIFSRDLIFHGLNIIILRGRGKSRINPGKRGCDFGIQGVPSDM